MRTAAIRWRSVSETSTLTGLSREAILDSVSRDTLRSKRLSSGQNHDSGGRRGQLVRELDEAARTFGVQPGRVDSKGEINGNV